MCLEANNCDAWRVLGVQLEAIQTVSRTRSRRGRKVASFRATNHEVAFAVMARQAICQRETWPSRRSLLRWIVAKGKRALKGEVLAGRNRQSGQYFRQAASSPFYSQNAASSEASGRGKVNPACAEEKKLEKINWRNRGELGDDKRQTERTQSGLLFHPILIKPHQNPQNLSPTAWFRVFAR